MMLNMFASSRVCVRAHVCVCVCVSACVLDSPLFPSLRSVTDIL